MQHHETYNYLCEHIAKKMRDMCKKDALFLASEITCLVNESIAGYEVNNRELDNFASKSEIRRIAECEVPKTVRGISSLALGWDAYRMSHTSIQTTTSRGTHVDFVYTIPDSFNNIRETQRESNFKVSPGSLIQCVYELINRSSYDLFIISPYWSYQGVLTLLKHVTRTSMIGVSVTIVTQRNENLKEDERDAVSILHNKLQALGANVVVLCPLAQKDSKRHFVHAKAVIMDGVEAYIGSANFTRSGMDDNIEIGAHLKGTAVINLKAWKKCIVANCENLVSS